jgi:hypothetical protein
MKYVLKCKDCVYGCDSMEDVARIINQEWDDFLACEEREYADVSPGSGRFWDKTEDACRFWLEHLEYGRKAEYAYGELWVPEAVRRLCADDLEEIESEIEAEGDWLREAVRDYRASVR